MQNILIAVDFTRSNQAVLDAAVPLAKAMASQLHLVHALAPEPQLVGYEAYVYPGPDAREAQLREEKAIIRTMASDLEARGLANVTASIEEGEPVDVIMRQAQDRNADLIVLGSHHRGFLQRILETNTTERVVRKADRPLLIVPTD